MLRKSMCLKAAAVCAAVVGMAQASTIDLTPTPVNLYNTSWQNIEDVSYSWNDINNDGVINVGEKGQLIVTMDKDLWGHHLYDALKVWVDDACINTPTGLSSNTANLMTATNTDKFMWNFAGNTVNSNGSVNSVNWNDGIYGNKAWTGGAKTFTFDYNFTTAGTYDIAAAVMCSADLDDRTSPSNGYNLNPPDMNDWNAWTQSTSRYQGQTNKYQITVKQNVPEPSSLSLILLGLSGLAGSLFIRRKNK